MKKSTSQHKQNSPSQDQPESRHHTVCMWLLDHPRIFDLLVYGFLLGLLALMGVLA